MIDLVTELESIVDWYLLGTCLNLKVHQLKCIEENYNRDVTRCKIEVLSLWLDNPTTPTWEAVATAVGLMGTHGKVADTILHKYITFTFTFTFTTSNRGTGLLHMYVVA